MRRLILIFVIVTSYFTVNAQTGVSDVNFTPQSILHVHLNAASGNLLQLTNTTTGNGSNIVGFKLNYSGNDINFINNQAGFMSFYTSNSERMRILSGGNIGIGTTIPGYKLDIQGGNLNVGTLYGTYVMYGTLGSFDTRATNPWPETYNMGITSEFKGNAANSLNDGGTYNSVLSIRQWGSSTDWSGGGVSQLAFTQNGNVWHRYSQTTGSWGAWKRLYDSGNGGLITCGNANYVVKSDGTNGICSQIFDNGTNVGIGTAGPNAKLDIGTTSSCCATQTPTLGISELTSSNGRLPWIQFHTGGFQEAFLRLASSSRTLEIGDGQNVGTELAIMNNAATVRNVVISGKSTSYFMGGSVGIGTTTPGYRLDLAGGTFGFGLNNARTEYRTNAGLQGNAGAQSGFFENDGGTVTNYPAGASSWWHLIDCRHDNPGNNYALQIAGSFFDQKLYFRKTNNNASQAWTEVLSSANNPVCVSLASDYAVNALSWTTIAPMSVTFTATKTTALVQFTCSGFAYTNSMSYVQFRVWNSTVGNSCGGTNTHMQTYDDTKGTITPWSCAFSKNITGLTPGTSYTLIIQSQVGGIWGTYDAVVYAASRPDEHHMTLTVIP